MDLKISMQSVRRGRRERARVGELTRASRSSISVATRFCPSSAWRQHRHSLELEAGMLPSPSRPLRVSADYARPRNGRIRPEYSTCDQPLRLVSHFSLLFTKNQRNSSAPAVRKRSALCLFTFSSQYYFSFYTLVLTDLTWVLLYIIPMYAACIHLHIIAQHEMHAGGMQLSNT